MTVFSDLQSCFPKQIALRPSGHYAHIITLRIAESYPIFQTDDGLNVARVPIGRVNPQPIDRIAMFLRKQTTPERLRGRELLRKYSPEAMEACRYNDNPCGQCPDCIAYGYAIGDEGAEKSKVFGDMAYSLSGHAISHIVNTLNAPNEGGIMYDPAEGKTSNRINSREYVIPGVIFPSVMTARDLTFPMFCYVLNNLVSNKRYGATTTRTGRMDNEVVAIVVADGEIMSNLALTQAIYDALSAENRWPDDDLVSTAATQEVTSAILPDLIRGSDVQIQIRLMGRDLDDFLNEFREAISQNFEGLVEELYRDVADYRNRLKTKPKKGK